MPEAMGSGRGSLPTGSVTFLFADVEGSTRLWDEHPSAMAEGLKREEQILHSGIESHRGFLIKARGEGDSAFAVFSRATDAIGAAVAIQRDLLAEPWPDAIPIRVRIAVHTGDAELRQGDYFGPAVNRCARLRAIAHGGQILLSGATKDLAADSLPAGASLRALGSHRLRDLARPENVYQLDHPELPSDFPPLVSLDALPNNLPAQLTTFIGREDEIDAIKNNLKTARLVTLTGSGGVGKTRLALQVAADLLDDFPGGVWLVELAALQDPDLVAEAVAVAAGLRQDQSADPGEQAAARPARVIDALADHLKSRTVLLILDNCEHLIESTSAIADTLLRSCPELRILASSREPLGVGGESIWVVPPLELPESEEAIPGEIAEFEGIRLFVDRASLARPGFGLDPANAASVVRICRALDGIPLALELAAALIKVLTPEQIEVRLSDRFGLLTGGSRTALPRYQTLRAAIDWSHDLLTGEEGTLFRRLAVFSGGFSLEAVEAVCFGEDCDALTTLSNLVAKSLIQTDQVEGSIRYSMLETLRQYGEEKLTEAGEDRQYRAHQRDWVLDLAEQIAPRLVGPEQSRWLEILETEHDNLRSALRFSLVTEPQMALRMAGRIWLFWGVRGYLEEGRGWLEAALSECPDPTPDRARALVAAGVLARYQGDFTAARAHLEQALGLATDLGRKREVMGALTNLGYLERYQGDYAEAGAHLRRALDLAREMKDHHSIAVALANLGVIALKLADYSAARIMLEEGLSEARAIEDRWTLSFCLQGLGNLALAEGSDGEARALFEENLQIERALRQKRGVNEGLQALGRLALSMGDAAGARRFLEEAVAIAREVGDRRAETKSLARLGAALADLKDPDAGEVLEEALSLARELGDKPHIAAALEGLGDTARARSDHGTALTRYREALAIRRELDDLSGIAGLFEKIGALHAARQSWHRALELIGAAEALREKIGSSGPRSSETLRGQVVLGAEEEIGPTPSREAIDAGRGRKLDDTVTLALTD